MRMRPPSTAATVSHGRIVSVARPVANDVRGRVHPTMLGSLLLVLVLVLVLLLLLLVVVHARVVTQRTHLGPRGRAVS